MNRRLFLLLIFCVTCLWIKSQTLYWVGGSGNFNDAAHWSLASGGSPANRAPSATTPVVFDNLSGAGSFTVNIGGNISAASLITANTLNRVVITGDRTAALGLGAISLSDYCLFAFKGNVRFQSSESQLHPVNFGLNQLSCNLFFGAGNYAISAISQEPGVKTAFENGSYRFSHSSLVTDHLQIRSNAATFAIDTTYFVVRKTLQVRDRPTFNSRMFTIYAPFSKPQQVNIPADVSFGSDRVISSDNSVSSVCGASVYAYPSCSGSCTGLYSVVIDPACTSTYNIIVTNTTCPSAASDLSASDVVTTYTFGSACACNGANYAISVYEPNTFALLPITFVVGGTGGGNFNFTAPNFNLLALNTITPSCNQTCNGSMTVGVIGGTSPFTISTNASVVTSPFSSSGSFTLGNLCGGLYSFTITDAYGCTGTSGKNMPAPTLLVANPVTHSVTCSGACDGAFFITPNNSGTSGYTVSFSTGSVSTITGTNSAFLSGMCPGAISATVTDAKGCTVTANSNIIQPSPLALTPTQTNVICGGSCSGAASVAVSGGIAPYTYSWSSSGGTLAGVSGICAGTYSVVVKDHNNCTYLPTPTFTITQPTPIVISPTIQNVSCHGLSDGSATVTASGGNSPITFTWVSSSGTVSTAPSLTAVAAGIYTVFAKDAVNCIASTTIIVTQPPALTLTATTQSVTCIGACSGVASVSVTGGNGAPFTYSWTPTTPTQTNQTATNLCAGNYNLFVKDAIGCPVNTVVTIVEPNTFTPAITTASLACNGICTGSIGINPSGGGAPYSYTLASASATVTSATPSFTGLCAGIYTLSIIDVVSPCPQLFTITIAEPGAIIPSISTTSVTCFGSCNGVLTGNAIGGLPGYNFSWITSTGPVSGAVLSNRCAGDYTLLVTDSHSCVRTTSITLQQPTDITFSITPSNASCFASCNGALSATVSGGVPGYTLAWSNGASGTPNTSLCAGMYTLTVIDFNGCPKTGTASISSPGVISLTQTAAPTSCAMSCDGSASITASGGMPAYTYAFNTSPVITNTTGITHALCAGNYIVNVSDINGCSQSIPISITSPAALSAAITGIQGSCSFCTGASTVTPSNGAPGYSYVWTNSLSAVVGNTNTASGLCPGNYTVLVTDSKNCAATAPVSIPETVVAAPVTGGTGIQCFGACTGSAVVSPSGGSGPYSYTWTPTGQNTRTATALCAGIYTVTVKEGSPSGCTSTSTISILSPPILTVTATKTNVTCFEACNGAISAVASGGTGVISYSWSPFGQTTSAISGLCAGVYSLQVTDANGCMAPVQVFTITQPSPITASFTSLAPTTCTMANGSICVSAAGGTGGSYTYTWLPGAGSTSCITGLAAGPYSVIVSDGVAGCTTTLTTLLNNPTGPSLTLLGTQSVSCFGGTTGAATIAAAASAPMSFAWSPTVTSLATGSLITASALGSGTYILTVEDVNSCVKSITVPIVQASQVTVNAAITNPKCNDAVCNGSIIVSSPSGGTPGYTYSWSPGEATSQNLLNVCAGTYSLVVTDGHSCHTTYIYNVSAPPLFTLTATGSNIKCTGLCNGSVVANASGGTAPISYSWIASGAFSGSTTASILNLCAGIYTVNAIDGNNCLAQGINTVQIIEPPLLTSTLVLQNASCSNSCDATASLVVGGGTLPYSYGWSTGSATTALIGNLCAGNYTGTVTDAGGCTSAKGFTVTLPPPFTATVVPTNPKCNPLSYPVCTGSIATLLSGAQGSVSFSWLPGGSGQNPTNLCSGAYTLIATDANGCQALQVASLTDPPALLSNVTYTNPTCHGACNGLAIISPTNAQGAVSVTWTPTAPSTPAINNLCGGNYTVEIADGNGCLDTQTFTLLDPVVLNVNTANSAASCTLANGSITAAVSGGQPGPGGYTYSWSPPVVSTSSVAANLSAGIYTLAVSDGLCTNTVIVPLNNANGPTSAPVITSSIACHGQCTGAASVNPSGIAGGAPGYNITWLPSSAESTINPLTDLCTGVYTAKITDALGCILFTTTTISEPNAISSLPSMGFPTCLGVCNGSISLATSGGDGAYTYSWIPAVSSSSVLTNACPGDYTVMIGYGGAATCTSPPLVLTLPAVMDINITTGVTPNTCFGNCNASAYVTSATGVGSSQFAYAWSNGQNGSSATGFCNGNYSVIATSPSGCMETFTFAVSSPPAITSTIAVTQPSCNQCNGTASIAVSGGVGLEFTYSWSSGTNSYSTSSLCAGLYQVTVTDAANNCAQTETFVVNNSNGISGATFNTQNILCSETCNGSATVTAVGGNGAISYNWLSPAVSGSVLTNLCTGTYYVQMSDAQGCVHTSSVDITAANSMAISEFIQQPGCVPPTSGSIDVLVSGGTPAYTYSWQPTGSTSSSLTGIAAGVYTLIVMDGSAMHCSLTQVYDVSNLSGPIVSYTQSNVNCAGSCTGSISAAASGTGNAFSWSNGSSSAAVTNLCAGVITLTVTAPSGCTTIRSFTITENPALQINTPQIIQPSCNLCNGGATVTPFGGVAPYTYSWTNDASGAAATGLCSGIYEVTIADAMNCQQTQTLVINNSNGISGQNFNVQPVSCSGNCNGSVTVTAIGGAGPITYQWLEPAVTNSVLTNLCESTYYVQMTDAQHCVHTASVNVTAASNLVISATIISPNCNAANGAVNLNIAGGTPTYGIVWTPGGNTTPSLSGISAGIYSVTVSDSAPGTCTVTQGYVVNNTNGPFVTASQTNVACFGSCTGVISVSATVAGNPSASFNYYWSNGSLGSTASGLCQGVVTLTVTDAVTGCSTFKTFTITENPVMNINTPAVVQPSCNLCNGTASVSVFGGVAPYQYVWTNGSASPAVSGLCAGIYQVQVTDAVNCQRTQNVVINNSTGITGQNFNVQNILCGGSCNGSATVTAVGGNAPVSYQWVNPAVTNSVISNLCEGIYFVQMVDAQNCVRTASVDITAAVSLSVSGAITSPSCTVNNGAINLTIAGGTPSYAVSWFPGGTTTPTLSGIGAGSYTVTVHDSPPGSCTVTQVFQVSNTTGPSIVATQTNINCFGACTGVVSVTAITPGNSSASFAYSWSNGSSGAAATGLCSGVITLTVTDIGTGCTSIKAFTVTENPQLQINPPSITQPSCGLCNGTASVTVFGGTAPYQYVWTTGDNTPAVSGLCAGLYQVQITDALNCQSTQNAVINNSNGITGENFNVQNVQCSSSCNGAATITAVGGTAPISYNWISPAATGQTITNLCSGNYFIQMSDAAGCIRTASLAIAPAVDFSISAAVVPPACGITPPNGSVNITVNGGSGSYQYSWTPGGIAGSQINNVGVGSYSVRVTDLVYGCSHQTLITLSNPAGPAITFAETDINCFGACTGSVIAVSTATNPLNYLWSTGNVVSASASSTVSGLCKGVITVTVTDATTGCSAVNSFNVEDNSSLQLGIPNVVDPNCHNSCDGQITVLPSGGSLPYLSYSWTPNGSGNDNHQTNLCAGDSTVKIYTVTIKDAKGCSSSATIQLNNPPEIALSYSVTDASCSAVADGSIGITPSNGTPTYTTNWSGPNSYTASTFQIDHLFPGTYSLHLLDQKGCLRDTTINLVSTVSVQANAGADATVCPSGSVILTGTNSGGSTPITYDWFISSNSVTPLSSADSLYIPVTVRTNSVYILQVNSNIPGCFDQDTVLVNVQPDLIIDPGPVRSILLYSTVVIGGDPTAFGDVTILWSPSETLNDPTLLNPIASNTADVTYTLMVTDNTTGCSASDTTAVLLVPAINPPSGFSPNGDGKNDRWVIDFIDQFPHNTVEIYNRWGDRLFSSQGYNTPFDGRYHNKDLPVGTYYYIISLNDPNYPKPYTGPLTIFR